MKEFRLTAIREDMSIVNDPHGRTGLIDGVHLLDKIMEDIHGDVLSKIGHDAADLVGVGRLAREGRQSTLDWEVLVNVAVYTVQESLFASEMPLVILGHILKPAFEDVRDGGASLSLLGCPRCR